MERKIEKLNISTPTKIVLRGKMLKTSYSSQVWTNSSTWNLWCTLTRTTNLSSTRMNSTPFTPRTPSISTLRPQSTKEISHIQATAKEEQAPWPETRASTTLLSRSRPSTFLQEKLCSVASMFTPTSISTRWLNQLSQPQHQYLTGSKLQGITQDTCYRTIHTPNRPRVTTTPGSTKVYPLLSGLSVLKFKLHS
jgi:hypothetical protein